MHEPGEPPPLIAFSFYSHVQVTLLAERAAELQAKLDKAFSAEGVDGSLFDQIYGEFWLWVLGAYECTRTMCQHRHCFSEEAAGRLQELKRLMATIRIPFAKQELRGAKRAPVCCELSVSAADSVRKDLAFEIGGALHWMRDPLRSVVDTMSSFSAEDILHRLGTPNSRGAGGAA